MLFSKILLPVDGSEHSLHAAKQARGVAKTQGAEIVLLHSFGPLPMILGGSAREEVVREERGESEKILAKFREILAEEGGEGIKVHAMTAEGNPADVIISEAKKQGCDLIVMGSRGLTDMEGLVLGSVSHKVLHAAHCPVLISR